MQLCVVLLIAAGELPIQQCLCLLIDGTPFFILFMTFPFASLLQGATSAPQPVPPWHAKQHRFLSRAPRRMCPFVQVLFFIARTVFFVFRYDPSSLQVFYSRQHCAKRSQLFTDCGGTFTVSKAGKRFGFLQNLLLHAALYRLSLIPLSTSGRDEDCRSTAGNKDITGTTSACSSRKDLGGTAEPQTPPRLEDVYTLSSF